MTVDLFLGVILTVFRWVFICGSTAVWWVVVRRGEGLSGEEGRGATVGEWVAV